MPERLFEALNELDGFDRRRGGRNTTKIVHQAALGKKRVAADRIKQRQQFPHQRAAARAVLQPAVVRAVQRSLAPVNAPAAAVQFIATQALGSVLGGIIADPTAGGPELVAQFAVEVALRARLPQQIDAVLAICFEGTVKPSAPAGNRATLEPLHASPTQASQSVPLLQLVT